MLEHGGLRIFSAHPVRDRAEIYKERAGIAWKSAKSRIEEAVEDRLGRICAKISKVIAAEERAEREWERTSGRKVSQANLIGTIEILIMAKWELQNPSNKILAEDLIRTHAAGMMDAGPQDFPQ
jgi:hypothetical protein